jgi:PAS domain S-box-containing protein
MAERNQMSPQKLRLESKLLRARVKELEETVDAIRGGQVDALVIDGPSGDQIFTLQGAEHPYRVLVESINEGAATMDVGGTVLYANGRLAELLGVPLDKLIGTPMQDHLSPREWYKLSVLIEKGRENPASCEIASEDGDGRRRILRLSVSPFRGSSLGLICAVATDVTEVVEANEAQKKSEQELQALSGRLLRTQDDERRRISRDLHDVSGQTLVALTLTLSQLERTETLQSDASAQEFLAECRALSEQLGQEIRTLSYLLHPPLLDEVGLGSPVQWYIDGFVRRTGIQVDVDIPHDFMRLPPDTELALFRVVQESLTNVHRYSGSATAQVRLEVNNGEIRLEIKDQGKGMPEGFLKSGGTSALLGVGIQGMRERMRQLSGRLAIGPGPAGGVRVVATIPIPAQLHEALAATANSAETPPTNGTNEEQTNALKRILIVDDHEMIRQGVRGILQRVKGWTICGEAVDGNEAIEKALTLRPDLVILDINMPVKDGLAALRQIRKLRPQTKVLMFTVNDSDHALREIKAAGADGYLCKSNASRDLIQAVKTIFELSLSSLSSVAQA